jgi:hypothetical protein
MTQEPSPTMQQSVVSVQSNINGLHGTAQLHKQYKPGCNTTSERGQVFYHTQGERMECDSGTHATRMETRKEEEEGDLERREGHCAGPDAGRTRPWDAHMLSFGSFWSHTNMHAHACAPNGVEGAVARVGLSQVPSTTGLASALS